MVANSVSLENELVQAAVAWLGERLPPSWEVGPTNRADLRGPSDGAIDAAIDLRAPNGTMATIAVEVKKVFSPRDVDRLLGSLGRVLRKLAGHIPILVVAPWLSPRTQELLRAEGLNYLDLTGNAWVRLENPTLFIQTEGSRRDPMPLAKSKARVQGPKAGRLVRLLVDVAPPYGVRQLATSAGLTPGYVSRLLDSLDDEAIVERSDRGQVVGVDIGRLLRRWAVTYDVFRSNETTRYLAPAGAASVLPRLAAIEARIAVTGSFAAVRRAPVAGPALLALYSDQAQVTAEALDLIPTEQGANVVLLRPFDPVVWTRTEADQGITYVAPSQTAVDCLTGNGRMPAEGEALIDWMVDDETAWRLPTLPEAAMLERSDG